MHTPDTIPGKVKIIFEDRKELLPLQCLERCRPDDFISIVLECYGMRRWCVAVIFFFIFFFCDCQIPVGLRERAGPD